MLIRDTTSFPFGSRTDHVFAQTNISNNVILNTTPTYLYIDPSPATAFFSGPTSSPTLVTGSFFGLLRSEESSLTETGPLVVTDITPTSPVPEPSSLALLGTGLFGTMGVLRKRFA